MTDHAQLNIPLSNRVGDFELISRIGKGAMGIVYRARQVSLDRIVALKLLPRQIEQKDPQFVERFFREARISARLNHPNIIQGIEVGKDDATGVFFFAMELVDGPSVQDLITREEIIEERTALQIARAIASALVCSHKAGIIHRDIKPENILLTQAGEPKLADLGLAKQALQDGDDPALASGNDAGSTQAGHAVGTPYYMSPEQAMGLKERIDIRTDLYSLGATMFHMVTGRPPFTGASGLMVMKAHVEEPAPAPRTFNPKVTPATSALITRLLSKARSDRVQTPDELVTLIDRILAGETEVPSPNKGSRDSSKAIRRASVRRIPARKRTPQPGNLPAVGVPASPGAATPSPVTPAAAVQAEAPALSPSSTEAPLIDPHDAVIPPAQPAAAPHVPESLAPSPLAPPTSARVLSAVWSIVVVCLVVGACGLTVYILMGKGTLRDRLNNVVAPLRGPGERAPETMPAPASSKAALPPSDIRPSSQTLRPVAPTGTEKSQEDVTPLAPDRAEIIEPDE
ncbi:MAG TPA: protein kinase [Planctomycetota bacterium]|nr:protein kinase [Planctomycetota bacterium]